MLTIKVLGSGCANCKKVESITKDAIAKLGVDAVVEKVEDYPEIMKYNVLATPGLVVNEQLVAAGRIPSEAEVTNWIANAVE